jgi:hypothetical protein
MTTDDNYGFRVSVDDAKDVVLLEIEGFDTDIERQEFADLLFNTLKFDKLYLMKLLSSRDRSTLH